MNAADTYLAMLVIIAVMVGSIALFSTFHKPRRMRATDATPSRPAPPMPDVRRHHRAMIERLMLADQSITFEVAGRVWGAEPPMNGDTDRACFFAVWAGVRREMAEAILKEIENG